jgi:hypothetical protein
MLLSMVARGEIHLSGIQRLSAHLTPDNHQKVLAAAKHQSTREIEKLVAGQVAQAAGDATTLKTVGDWVKALSKTVGTGAHVLTLVGLTIASDSGVRVAYEARVFLPFSVEDGANTAFAGHAELVLPGEPQ